MIFKAQENDIFDERDFQSKRIQIWNKTGEMRI